jgi:hypothetical protein
MMVAGRPFAPRNRCPPLPMPARRLLARDPSHAGSRPQPGRACRGPALPRRGTVTAEQCGRARAGRQLPPCIFTRSGPGLCSASWMAWRRRWQRRRREEEKEALVAKARTELERARAAVAAAAAVAAVAAAAAAAAWAELARTAAEEEDEERQRVCAPPGWAACVTGTLRCTGAGGLSESEVQAQAAATPGPSGRPRPGWPPGRPGHACPRGRRFGS